MHRSDMPALRHLRHRLRPAFGALALALSAASAEASVLAHSPDPFPPGAVFTATGGGAGCFPNAGVCVAGGGTLSNISTDASSFDATGQELVLGGTLTTVLTDLASHPIGKLQLTGTLDVTIFGRSGPSDLGTWSTEITALDFTGTLGGHKIEATDDPANPSTGSTTISGGADQFHIDSFFDIFVELKLDTVPPLTTERGPLHAELTSIAEPAGLALLALPLAALPALRRRSF